MPDDAHDVGLTTLLINGVAHGLPVYGWALCKFLERGYFTDVFTDETG